MSDITDDRTHPASERRRTEAWQTGTTPKSSPLTTAVVVLSVLIYAVLRGGAMVTQCGQWLQQAISAVASGAVSPADLLSTVQTSMVAGIDLACGVLLTGLAAAVAAEFLQSGWKWSPGLVAPRPERFVHVGTQRIWSGFCSARPWAEAVRWLLPLGLLLALLVDQWPRIAGLVDAGPVEMAELGGELSMRLLGRLSVVLLLLGLAHLGWQRWSWEQSLRMTPEELREEQRHDRRRGR